MKFMIYNLQEQIVCRVVKRLLHDAEPGKKEGCTLSLACQMVVKCCL